MIVSDFLKDQDGVRHGFFTRQGGVSTGLYASLNCGFGSGDQPANVQENRRRVVAKLGVDDCQLLTVRQVHSNRTVIADRPWAREDAPEADAIVTATSGLAVAVLTADCTPILFCDAEAGVIGAAHAGWKGAKSGIVASVIEAMESLGASRESIHVAIGPTISQRSYEVGHDFRQSFLDDHPDHSVFFTIPAISDKPYFDLPEFCRYHIIGSGCQQVDDLKLCTYENESLFFSFRRTTHRKEADYGRQISAIVLL